jgi:hypothetical protein
MSQRTFGVAAANTTARRLSFYFAALQVGTTLGIEAVSSLGSSLLAWRPGRVAPLRPRCQMQGAVVHSHTVCVLLNARSSTID